MTLDNDTGYFPPSPPRKSYNPFDSDDDTLDSPGLKSENVYTEEDHVSFDLKPFQKSADPLTFHIDNGDLSWEEAIFGQPAVNPSANGHTSLFVQDGQLYTDKNVTDCELPEVVVCYKENSCQSVRDIGIDEGVPVHDKLWVQSSEDESKDSSALLPLSGKGSDAMDAENDFGRVDVPEVKDGALHTSKDLSAGGLKENVLKGQYLAQEFGDEDSLKLTKLKLDLEDQASLPADWATTTVETAPGGSVYDVVESHTAAGTDPDTNISKCELNSMGKDVPDHDDTEEKKGDHISPDKLVDGVSQELIREETPSKVITECEEAKVKPDESPNEENPLPSSSKDVQAQELSDSIDPIKTDSNIKLESGSTTSDSNSDEPQKLDPEKPPITQSMTRHEEVTSSKSPVASLELRGLGETSFSSSVPAPLPSSITFTGPVSYSGNISLRSESSAGSTRSFAFPVLQTELNSSPVRMAKADQRHCKKQRGWVQSLICCRF